jgi:Ca-activated chloride channel family protein
LLDDAGSRANNASVSAEVFFVAADALGSPLKLVAKLPLSQSGPGLYESRFRPDQAGVYLVRAQAGADMVSAGLVHHPASEASLGTINESLLDETLRISGGQKLGAGQVPELKASKASQFTELWPPLMVALVLLFLVDIGIRRWEHVQGLWEAIARKT